MNINVIWEGRCFIVALEDQASMLKTPESPLKIAHGDFTKSPINKLQHIEDSK